MPEISLQQAFACFQPGGVLVMYSDGLLERYNNLGEEFGLEPGKPGYETPA